MKKILKEHPVKTFARQMLREGEIDSAEAALAAKDQVDRLQDMVEEISKMANEELPKLVDKIRSSFGGDKATAYQEAAGSVFSDLLNVVKEKKSSLEQSVLVLTGDAQAEVGQKTDLNLPDEETAGEDNTDLNDADFIPDLDSEDAIASAKKPAPLGRETRLPAEESRAFNLKLNRAKIIAIKEALDKTDAKKYPMQARRLAEELNRLAIIGIKEEAKSAKAKKGECRKCFNTLIGPTSKETGICNACRMNDDTIEEAKQLQETKPKAYRNAEAVSKAMTKAHGISRKQTRAIAHGWDADNAEKSSKSMMKPVKESSGENGYVCFFNRKRVEVHAPSVMAARTKAAEILKVPENRRSQISVTLAERPDGSTVKHIATEASNMKSGEQMDGNKKKSRCPSCGAFKINGKCPVDKKTCGR